MKNRSFRRKIAAFEKGMVITMDDSSFAGSPFCVRLLSPGEEFAASRVYFESWRSAYRGIVDDDYLDALRPDRWAKFLAPHTGNVSAVLLRGKEIVGSSAFTDKARGANEGWWEIISFYLLPQAFGTGGGRQMMDWILRQIRLQGGEKVFLWTLERNARARRFYEKCGFTLAGDATTVTLGKTELTEVKYEKRLFDTQPQSFLGR